MSPSKHSLETVVEPARVYLAVDRGEHPLPVHHIAHPLTFGINIKTNSNKQRLNKIIAIQNEEKK